MALNAHSVNRLVAALLLTFSFIALGIAYWTVIAANDLVARVDNPRRIEAQQMQQRGALYDRNGQLLAHSTAAGQTASGQPFMQRVYPQSDAISATGYFNVVHGVSGAEQAFDAMLRGEPIPVAEQASNDLLHRPPAGQDVRLTIDLTAQQAAAAAMRTAGITRGAVVAIDVPSGAIRVLLSAPGYDPNTFDDPTSFDSLIKDPAAPLLNRALQGVYQPGGALETVIMSALLTAKVPVDQVLSGVNQPLVLPDLTIGCGLTTSTLTIQGAYAAACPVPFSQAAVDHSADIIRAIQSFGLTSTPAIAGFVTSPGAAMAVTSTSTPLPIIQTTAQLTAQGAGQGSLTVSPLQMALVAAIVANHGNSVPLYLADASRAAGNSTWQPLAVSSDQPGVIAQDVANTIRTAMRQAVLNGTARAANFSVTQPAPTVTAALNTTPTPSINTVIYGHASLAYSGSSKTPLAWFIGFIDLPNGHSVAIAVILENTPDLNTAATVAGAALQAIANTP
jgi:peptidoglycan glycosyltransferase